MSRQRRVILEVLRGSLGHPTAEDVYEQVRRRVPRISLGTVYRNLDLLVELGEVHRLRLDEGPARFDGCLAAHHHVRCVGCGGIADAPAALCEVSAGEVAKATGYEILDWSVTLEGLCPRCRAAREKKRTLTEREPRRE